MGSLIVIILGASLAGLALGLEYRIYRNRMDELRRQAWHDMWHERL